MFLFKNTKSIIKRIGMNIAVYGFAGSSLLMMLALFLPKIIVNYIYILMVICSIAAIIGSIVSGIYFLIEFFSMVKQDIKKTRENRANEGILREQKRMEKLLNVSTLLFLKKDDWYDKNDFYHYFEEAFYLTPKNDIISRRTTGKRDAHNARYGSQLIYRKIISFDEFNEVIKNHNTAEANYFEGITKNNCREYVPMSLFSKRKNGAWIVRKNLLSKETFSMQLENGEKRNFKFIGHSRYSSNQSSTSGYGSDDWMYLCEEKNTHYLLMFSDDASCGTYWMCTELLEGDHDRLLGEDVSFWRNIAHSNERTKIYGFRLTDVGSVRRLLPTSSRCGKLPDESYLR